MSGKVSLDDKRRIIRMRALDHSKQEIAEAVGVSRNTVDYHLEKIREEVKSYDEENQDIALAEFLFEPEDLLPFVMEEAENPLENVDLDQVSIPLGRVIGNNND